jgi:hypothetical protein
VLEDPDTGARALIMTHVPGESLQQILRRDGPLDEAQLWRVLLDVTDVLRTLHRARVPIVHRDIKPQNLIRRPDGGISVVDFGGVGRVGPGAASTVVGTFGYMAPEQLYGTASAATDLYALGATLLTLATGEEPEAQPRDGLHIHVDQALPQGSASMRGILARLLSPDPRDRPADAGALWQELEGLANTAKVKSATVPPSNAEPASVSDMFWGWLDFILGMMTLMIGLGGWVVTAVLGEILLPLALAVAVAFSGPETRKRLLRIRASVRTGSEAVKQSFRNTARTGVAQLQRTQMSTKHRHAPRKAGQTSHRRRSPRHR